MDIPVLALTPGEPAGIGPECTIRLLKSHPELRILTVADPYLLSTCADTLGSSVDVIRWQPGDPVEAGRLNCCVQTLGHTAIPGQLDPANASYVISTIKTAVGLVRAGHAGALVTGPVHKGIINEAGVPFSGHTELLAELAGVSKVVMMLVADSLRVALVTTHLPLRDVAAAITVDNVYESIRITSDELRLRFGIQQPVIQVLGLNPHAGEGGYLGHEDADIIQVAINRSVAQGINAIGPVPADSAFTAPRLAACDAVLAMFHDQGLPVLKHAGFGQAVNITLGLPFIRTSVDHGTALDIAGFKRADASSMYSAALAAQTMCLQS